MTGLTATGGKQQKALSPEQVAKLKADVGDAMTKTLKSKGKAATTPDTEVESKKPKRAPANDKSTRARAPRGTYARMAAQQLMDSLVTPAPPSSRRASSSSKKPAASTKALGTTKKPAANTKSTKSAAAKAKAKAKATAAKSKAKTKKTHIKAKDQKKAGFVF